jgi:hypothetical protein
LAFSVSMDLPKLVPGRRYTLPRPAGSADSLLLAQLATREKAARRLTAIVTADATDAQRLIDEMAFFAPDLRCALFPDWETLPYDTFSPHQDLISERLATLWRIQQRDKDTGADVVVVPATTALYRLAPPGLPGGLHLPLQGQAEARRGPAQGPADPGRLQPRHPGGEPRRIRGARRADRPVPHGKPCSLPRRPVRRRDRQHPHLRPRQPAQPVSGARGAPAARPRVPDGRRRAGQIPQPLAGTARRRPHQEPHLQGHRQRRGHGRHRVLPAAVLRRHRHRVRLPGRRRHGGAARRPGAGLPALLAGHQGALPPGAGRPRTPGVAARGAVPGHRALLRPRQRTRPAGHPSFCPHAPRCAWFAAPRGGARRLGAARRRLGRQRRRGQCLFPEARRPHRGARRRRAAGPAAGPPARHAAPGAAAGRKRRPPREPARFPARQRRQPAGLRLAGRIPGQQRGRRHCHRRADHRLCLAGRRPGPGHRDRTLRRRPHHAPAQEAGAGQRCGCP